MSAPRILFVEDNEDINDLVRILLTSDGYDVAAFNRGQAAIKAATSYRPDLFLLDIHLPDLDGISVLQRLRGLTGLGKTPAIALTADAKRESRRRFVAAGFDAVVEKPILDLDGFSSIVRSLVDGCKPSQQ